jgi:hypothetical protein
MGRTQNNDVRFQVPKAASKKMTAFLDMTISLLMEAVRTSETSVYLYETIQRHIPQGCLSSSQNEDVWMCWEKMDVSEIKFQGLVNTVMDFGEMSLSGERLPDSAVWNQLRQKPILQN